jgi:uncharacterized protein (UPF0254 family)
MMNPKIEVSSLLVNKLKNSQEDFIKYDIDVALDEVESLDTSVKLKYKFALLSNPSNTKMSTEGFVTVYGNDSEVSKLLSPDEKNIPIIVNVVYQEIFPLFYLISKSMQIPCPSYRLSEISSKQQIEEKPEEAAGIAQIAKESTQENITIPADNGIGKSTESVESADEKILQEANVSSI